MSHVHDQFADKFYSEPDLSTASTPCRLRAKTGPICVFRSNAIDRKLVQLGYRKTRVMDGHSIVSVITIPLRAKTDFDPLSL